MNPQQINQLINSNHLFVIPNLANLQTPKSPKSKTQTKKLPKLLSKPLSPNSKLTRGVVYSAITIPYVEEAIRSAKTLKKVCPDIPITLYTDQVNIAQKANSNIFHQILSINMKEMNDKKMKLVPYAKLSKIRSMASFPYDITLYLDTDTKIVKPIYELFDYGQQYDITIANSPKLNKTKVPYTLSSYVWPKHYNSGVVLYRNNSQVQQLFSQWQKKVLQDKNIYRKHSGKFWDQPKLVELLNDKNCPIKLKVVPNTIYNARHTILPRMKKDGKYKNVKIIHKH